MTRDGIFQFVTKFFLVVSSFFWIPGMLPYPPQEMFLQYSAFVAFGLSFILPAKRVIDPKWLGIFFIYLCAQTILFNFTSTSRMALVNVFLGMFLLRFFAERIDSHDFKGIGWSFIVLALANTGLLLLQKANIDPIFSSINPAMMPQADTVGFMGSKFALGVWASLALPFVFRVHPLFVITLLPLFYFSHSSTACVAGVMAFLFMMWGMNKRIAILMSILLVIAAIVYVIKFDMPTGQFGKRFEVWLAAVTLSKDNIWMGHGLGKWKEMMVMTPQELPNTELKHWSWLHNDWLQFAFEGGVIGLLLLVAYFKDLFKSVKDFWGEFSDNLYLCTSAFIALVVASTFHFPFHIGRLAGISIFILACLEAERTDLKNSGIQKEDSYEEIDSVPLS